MEKRHESIAAQLAGKRKGYVPRTPSMIIWLSKPIDRFVGFKSKLCGVQCLIVPALTSCNFCTRKFKRISFRRRTSWLRKYKMDLVPSVEVRIGCELLLNH